MLPTPLSEALPMAPARALGRVEHGRVEIVRERSGAGEYRRRDQRSHRGGYPGNGDTVCDRVTARDFAAHWRARDGVGHRAGVGNECGEPGAIGSIVGGVGASAGAGFGRRGAGLSVVSCHARMVSAAVDPAATRRADAAGDRAREVRVEISARRFRRLVDPAREEVTREGARGGGAVIEAGVSFTVVAWTAWLLGRKIMKGVRDQGGDSLETCNHQRSTFSSLP